MTAVLPPPFVCVVAAVHDGDVWRCQDGRRIRAAGVDANELDGSCHTTCALMPADAARAYVDRLIYRQRLTCQPVDRSYRRVVAACVLPDGRRLECAEIARERERCARVVEKRRDNIGTELLSDRLRRSLAGAIATAIRQEPV